MPPRVDVEFEDNKDDADGKQVKSAPRRMVSEEESQGAELGSAMHPASMSPEAEAEKEMIEEAYRKEQITPSQR